MRRARVVGAIAAVWVLAAATSLLVASRTSIGPVVFVISRSHAEGVHVGDLVALAVSATVALLVSVAIVRGSRPQ